MEAQLQWGRNPSIRIAEYTPATTTSLGMAIAGDGHDSARTLIQWVSIRSRPEDREKHEIFGVTESGPEEPRSG